ncbi:MAG: hypothetical protein J6C98_06565 [Oscillospiraceae bacterium]|nr:hypothetical protein [Oscillospiraceae bacterium]
MFQLGDLGQSLSIVAKCGILHGAVCDQGNILAGLCGQFCFQSSNGFQKIFPALQIGVIVHLSVSS